MLINEWCACAFAVVHVSHARNNNQQHYCSESLGTPFIRLVNLEYLRGLTIKLPDWCFRAEVGSTGELERSVLITWLHDSRVLYSPWIDWLFSGDSCCFIDALFCHKHEKRIPEHSAVLLKEPKLLEKILTGDETSSPISPRNKTPQFTPKVYRRPRL